MGRLALIADELGQASIATAVRGRMKAALAPWLAGASGDPLRHDAVWGGTCSAAGLADGRVSCGSADSRQQSTVAAEPQLCELPRPIMLSLNPGLFCGASGSV